MVIYVNEIPEQLVKNLTYINFEDNLHLYRASISKGLVGDKSGSEH